MKKTNIYLNGKLIGFHDKAKELVETIRQKRRQGELPINLTVVYYDDLNEVYINTDEGRAMRPLIIVKNGKSMYTKEHEKMIKEGKMSFSDLVKNGVIEYLDAEEEENSYIALTEKEITKEHTHLEIHPSLMLGAVASVAPSPQHNSSPRVTMTTAMLKQALGQYALNYQIRSDTQSHIMYYTQEPLVQTKYMSIVGLDKKAAGQNFVVAIMPYYGYNIDDGLVLNKASVERGLARTAYFRTYSTEERKYPGGQKDKFQLINPEAQGYRGEEAYKYLDDYGIIEPEFHVKSGEVIVGKTSPPRFIEETGEFGLIEEKRRENSLTVKSGEEGKIDWVIITQGQGGNRLIKVRTRNIMIPEIGDKFAARHGQKGIIGLLAESNDMPFSDKGIIPDLCMNAHAVPSRMTASFLLECIGAKKAALKGKIQDATAFEQIDEEEIKKALKEYGFKENGKETLYDGLTGRKIEAEIFTGIIYYQKLKHLVANKIHVRARGPIQILTRQPTEGRGREGGLRFGEMERDCLIGHGTSMLLMERLLEESDKVTELVCSKCGMIAIEDKIRKKKYCPVCGSTDVVPIEMSYAFKLLLNEMKSMGVYPKLEVGDKA